LTRTKKIAMMLALCALALVAVAPVASAQPAKQGYDETTVLGNVDSGGPAPAAQETAPAVAESPAAETAPVSVQSNESSLPFTGADLGILVLMGVLLGGTGLVLRRVVRHRPTA
jgi:hypothetical protein